MYLLTRPSKIFLFNYLDKLLSKEKGEVGIDAAAERLRNRKMFRTDYYYGLDVNREALIRGLKSTPDPNTFAIEADLRDLSRIPEGCADVVLSSNTLYQIPMPAREQAVSELCRIVRPSGIIIIELTKDHDLSKMLCIIKENFDDVQAIYFKNPVSLFYEKLAYSPKSKERRLFATLPFRCFSWFISHTEYITKNIASLNKHIVVIAKRKNHGNIGGKLNINDFTKISDRLYSII